MFLLSGSSGKDAGAGSALGARALRVVVTGLVAVAAAWALWSSEATVSRQKGGPRTTVLYWEKWTGDEANAMRAVVNDFNASQDRIYVRMLSISDIADKTLLATSGGTPPDVAGLWADQVTQLSEGGALTDLTGYAREFGVNRSQYIAGYWDMMTFKGRLYALPTTPGSTALHVDRALMPPEAKNPEGFPKTLEGLDDLVDRISKKDSRGNLEIAGFIPTQSFGTWAMICLFGGKLVDGDRITIDSPENRRAFKWFASYGKRFGNREMESFQSGFGNFSSAENPFMCGKLGMVQQGVWLSNFIRLYNDKLDWYAVAMPPPADHMSCAGANALNLNTLMIPRGAKHPREAFEFMRFVQRQDVMENLCMAQRCNSPLAKVSERFFAEHPNRYIRLFDQLARSPNAVAPPHIGIWSQIGQEMQNAFDAANLGDKPTDEILAEAQKRMDEAWSKYKRQVLGR
jgi:ABC-type glycerol-3-phosphate transport system substrate-binding protein